MIKLEKWSLISSPILSMALGKPVGALTGFVYGHPDLGDGENIVTSPIVKLDIANKRAETRSGSKYVLGEPNPKWKEWLQKNGFNVTLEEMDKFENKIFN